MSAAPHPDIPSSVPVYPRDLEVDRYIRDAMAEAACGRVVNLSPAELEVVETPRSLVA
jgi:hypothetical protein